MNILYITRSDCLKPISGGAQRSYQLYNALKELGNVYVIQISNEVKKINDYYWQLPIVQQSGFKRIINLIWCKIFCIISKELVFYYFPFPNNLENENIYKDVKFDSVVVRYLNNVGIFHFWKYGPLYVDIDDYPMQVFDTVIADKINRIQRFFAKNVQKFFTWLCMRKVTGAWIANPNQYKMISNIKKSAVLCNLPIVDTKSNYFATSGLESYIFTVGLMSYEPNYEGVDSFLSNVWPKVQKKFPQLKYLIIGKGTPEKLTIKWRSIPGVKIMGFVDDLEPIYRNSLATVVPVQSGGGTCIKTIESLAYGRICFTTVFGARGVLSELPKDNEIGLFVYNNENEFIDYMKKILENSIFRNTCEEKNINYYKRNYSFEIFKSSVQKVLN